MTLEQLKADLLTDVSPAILGESQARIIERTQRSIATRIQKIIDSQPERCDVVADPCTRNGSECLVHYHAMRHGVAGKFQQAGGEKGEPVCGYNPHLAPNGCEIAQVHSHPDTVWQDKAGASRCR